MKFRTFTIIFMCFLTLISCLPVARRQPLFEPRGPLEEVKVIYPQSSNYSTTPDTNNAGNSSGNTSNTGNGGRNTNNAENGSDDIDNPQSNSNQQPQSSAKRTKTFPDYVETDRESVSQFETGGKLVGLGFISKHLRARQIDKKPYYGPNGTGTGDVGAYSLSFRYIDIDSLGQSQFEAELTVTNYTDCDMTLDGYLMREKSPIQMIGSSFVAPSRGVLAEFSRKMKQKFFLGAVKIKSLSDPYTLYYEIGGYFSNCK
jgi:hypothetical protein